MQTVVMVPETNAAHSFTFCVPCLLVLSWEFCGHDKNYF